MVKFLSLTCEKPFAFDHSAVLCDKYGYVPYTNTVTILANKHIENQKKILLLGIVNPAWKKKFHFLTLMVLNFLHLPMVCAFSQRKKYTSLRFLTNLMLLLKMRAASVCSLGLNKHDKKCQ